MYTSTLSVSSLLLHIAKKRKFLIYISIRERERESLKLIIENGSIIRSSSSSFVIIDPRTVDSQRVTRVFSPFFGRVFHIVESLAYTRGRGLLKNWCSLDRGRQTRFKATSGIHDGPVYRGKKQQQARHTAYMRVCLKKIAQLSRISDSTLRRWKLCCMRLYRCYFQRVWQISSIWSLMYYSLETTIYVIMARV